MEALGEIARTQESHAGGAAQRMVQRRGTPLGRPYRGETYYDQPALKASPFDYKVGAYLFVSGLGGAAQLLSAIADLFGPRRLRPMVRNGRMAALGSAVAGAVLLIVELKTPQRWYNMLRIFRATSPMSIGSYILTGFGALSGVCTLPELARRLRDGTARAPETALEGIARAAQVPAALAGAGMTTYTGALLASTSTPLWAAAPQLLPAYLGSSAVATAAAALSLAERFAARDDNARALDRVALVATAAAGSLSHAMERHYARAGVQGPLEEEPLRTAKYVGKTLGIVLPLACYGLQLVRRRDDRALSLAGALGVLAGAAVMRTLYLYAGNRSAELPRDYFEYAQPQARAARAGLYGSSGAALTAGETRR